MRTLIAAVLLLLSSVAYGAQAPHKLIDGLPIDVTPGTYELGPVLVGEQTKSISLRLARQTTLTPLLWGPGITVNASFSVSVNGGQTFLFVCGFGSVGGIDLRPDGTESPESVIDCPIPLGNKRLLIGSVTVTGGDLITLVTVQEQT